MNALVAACSGLLFAAGLVVGGMTSPARVIGFLDLLGDWDPQLAFVMGGALGTYALSYRLIRRHVRQPWLEPRYHVPSASRADAKLVVGAAMFGVGWGLMGFCPGPALVASGAGQPEALAFTVAMAAGSVIASILLRGPRPARGTGVLLQDDA